ncbi:MAG TPA: DUF4917 family protein [Enteractinococcus helveticum]|uniref:DUF4917 family protein n=1 Tax=Enteractinococcus helveticum TaxID=1837282 RepID=A0A921FMB2_9MICC|nr:DUF4917 family protein [Enteractinococcus helveticum]HJF13872.1 DUF4917 family protein [Enteractinococcus helveticum]
MKTHVVEYDHAFDWASKESNQNGPALLLGNGFSVAYDSQRFAYAALLDQARGSGKLSHISDRYFRKQETNDFERVIRELLVAADALEIMDVEKFEQEISELRYEAETLKELLAKSLASLHPERPTDVLQAQYDNVKNFVTPFDRVFTTNYDLLLYWTLMKQIDSGLDKSRDDGFRSPGDEHEYVVWDHLTPHAQNVYYLHGALHLYRDLYNSELQKLTWIRTGDALIDQIRRQLAANRLPLIVAEGTSEEKLAKIQSNAYLARSLRTLASIGGTAVIYGLSLSENDAHIYDAVLRSKIKRIAVSIYGDAATVDNQATITTANRLVFDRETMFGGRRPIEVCFYDASSVPLW